MYMLFCQYIFCKNFWRHFDLLRNPSNPLILTPQVSYEATSHMFFMLPLPSSLNNYVSLSLILGFDNVDRGCCGTGEIEVSWLCNALEPTCSDVSKHLFWDSFHPTESGYRIIVDGLMERYLNDVLSLWWFHNFITPVLLFYDVICLLWI